MYYFIEFAENVYKYVLNEINNVRLHFEETVNMSHLFYVRKR